MANIRFQEWGGLLFLVGSLVFASPEVVAQAEVPDAARKAVARRQEMMTAAQEKMARGDRLRSDEDFAGAYGEYRAAFQQAPGFAAGQPLQQQLLRKYQETVRLYADRLAREGRLDDARKTVREFYADVRDAGLSPRVIDAETKQLMADLNDPEVYNPAMTSGHLNKVKLVEEWLAIGEGALRIGRYEEAKRQFELVLNLDETNQAARRGLEEVEREIRKYGDTAYDHTRGKMLNEVAKSWEDPVPRFGLEEEIESAQGEADGTPVEAASVEEKLRTLIVPEVEFVETPLREALAFLANRSRQLDPRGEGVNIVLRTKDPAAGDTPVTIALRGAPLGTVLDYVGRMAGMSYRVDGYAVAMVPPGDLSDSAMITKSYRVPPGFLSEGAILGDDDPFAGADDDPFAGVGGGISGVDPSTLQPKLGAREFLEKNGIDFPAGSMAQFIPSTSTLVVRNTQSQLDLVETIVESSFGNVTKVLDITVKAIDIDQGDLEELGFDWLLGSFGALDRVQVGGGTLGSNPQVGSDFPFGTLDADGNPIAQPANPVTASLRSGAQAFPPDPLDAFFFDTTVGNVNTKAPGIFSVAGRLTNPQFQVVLRAVSQHKNSDELISGQVVVRSGQLATLKNVREFIYPTEYDPPELPDNPPDGGGDDDDDDDDDGGGNSLLVTPAHPAAFGLRELGTQMRIEGILSPEGHSVNLTLQPEVVEFEGFVNYGPEIRAPNGAVLSSNTILMPIFNVKRTEVTAVSYDGSTIVLGGLLNEENQHIQDKLPVLGDAPFVGKFFQSESERRVKRALLFFVTTRIVDPSGTPIREISRSLEDEPEP